MGERLNIYFDEQFLEILVKSQREAKQYGIKCISDILVVKNLIYTPNTDMSELLQLIGISCDDITEAMEKDIRLWVNEAKISYALDPENEEDKTLGEFIEEIKMYDLFFDEHVSQIFYKSTGYQMYDENLDELAFVLAMLDDPSSYVELFFKEIGVDTSVVLRYFEGLLAEAISDLAYAKTAEEMKKKQQEYEEDCLEEYQESLKDQHQNDKKEDAKFEIPKELQGFVKVLEADKSKTSPILGREEETERLTRVLLKAKKRNAVLIGEPGVGKTAIVEDLVWRIANGKCADELKNKTILALDVNDIIAGTTLRGMAEQRFKQVSDYLSKTENVILFIDEIHNVVGAGNTGFDEGNDFANALKPILAREGVSVIGATTEEEYERIFNNDGAFKRRLEKVLIEEPYSDEVYPMIKEQVRRLSKHHGIAITKPIVEYIIKVSGCFNFETCNPDRTLDLVDKSMATAKYMGLKAVTKEIVLKNFDANFKLFAKMSEEYKKSTAYHEAGHYLVARYAKNYKLDAMAVSIIPAEEYIGVTVYDDQPLLVDRDYNFHLARIARMLGGRVAEKIYIGKETSGASSDLEKAKDEARKMIVEYGLSSSFSFRNCDNDFYDEKRKKLDEEIDRITDEAYKIAENILKEHEQALNEIVNALLKNHILVKENLDKICRKAESKNVHVNKPDVAKVT